MTHSAEKDVLRQLVESGMTYAEAVAHTAESDAAQCTVHEPRCNTHCRAGSHYLTSGIGFPHLHRTDLNGECRECVIPPVEGGTNGQS